MKHSFFFFLQFFVFTSSFSQPLQLRSNFPFDISYHIDCGGVSNFIDKFNTSWISDRFYSGGFASVVSHPLRLPQSERSIRYFPLSFGVKNCYNVILPVGRYLIRTFTVYGDYDGKNKAPSFHVSVEGTHVFTWNSPWTDAISRNGAYSDLIAAVEDGQADICFYSIATDAPVIGSLEILQVDPESYGSQRVGDGYILVNYGRFSCGSHEWGLGFSNDTDLFGRSWQSDSEFRLANSEGVRVISTSKFVNGSNVGPNYIPVKLYQRGVIGEVEYILQVDGRVDYLLWFHFAEIDEGVKKAGERVFDVVINDENVTRVDIVKEVGIFSAFSWYYIAKNLSSTILRVKLVSVVGRPLINGLENYALIPSDLSTVGEQATAMKELKGSLGIPNRMGWNGDPCAPTSWNAWEGVTCHPNTENSALVISQIDLGSQGLKGYISEQIGFLSNLASLNMSFNSLEGHIPSGLGLRSLIRLDLSHNRFSGPIPDSLSSNLLIVLLNDNVLEGQVPEEVYSAGLHGGVTDISGNKGLCGAPSLPECAFWRRRLSPGGKAAIAVCSVAVLAFSMLLIYLCCTHRGSSDYDFGLPRDLIAMAAKRSQYRRTRSLMRFEIETRQTKDVPGTPNSR